MMVNLTDEERRNMFSTNFLNHILLYEMSISAYETSERNRVIEGAA